MSLTENIRSEVLADLQPSEAEIAARINQKLDARLQSVTDQLNNIPQERSAVDEKEARLRSDLDELHRVRAEVNAPQDVQG